MRLPLILLAILCSLISGPAGLSQTNPPPPNVSQPPVPVTVDGQALFYIKTGMLSFTTQVRAEAISQAIKKVAQNQAIDPRAIHPVEFEEHSEILAGEFRIATFTDLDAQYEGLAKSRKEIVAFYVQRIQQAVVEYRKARTPWNIFLGVLYALTATLVTILVLVLLKFLFRKIYDRIDLWRETKIKALQVQDLEVVSAERAGEYLVQGFRWVRIFLTAALFYIYVPLILGFFPWTRRAGAGIYSWSWNSVALVGGAIWGYTPNLFIIAVILLVTYYVVKSFRFLFQAVEFGRIKLPGVPSDLATTTFKLVRFLLIAFSLVVLYPYLPGSESAAFKGVSIFVGVLFSLGSTSVVANIFAGLSLTYMRAYKIGDRVKIGETTGDVIEIKMYGTRIRTIKNVYVTIPNSQILQGPIVNFSTEARERGLILHTAVTIGYDTPWRTVHQLLIDAALKTRDILKNPPPFVLQTALNDFYITYELNAYTHQASFMARIYSDLHENIQDTFNEAGTEIMSAHYMHVRDGSRTAIPDAYLPRDYEPRALRIHQNPTPGEETWRTGEKASEK